MPRAHDALRRKVKRAMGGVVLELLRERAEAQAILDRALDWLPLNCGSGRYSTRYIADPQAFERVRLDVGLELEKLLNR